MDAIGDRKVISIGVYATERQEPRPNKEKIAQKAQRDAYREQLERDMSLRAREKSKEKELDVLHPFDMSGPSRLRDKHNENVQEEAFSGYAIGSQIDRHEESKRKKDSQQKYLRQLDHDIQNTAEIRVREEVSPEKKVIPRRPPSPEVKGEFVIGAASTSDGVQKKEMAKEFYALNQQEINRKQMLKTQKSKDIDIDGRFAIGADESEKKKKQQEAMRVYMEALNKDLGDRGETRRVNKDDEYVNRTGWSGLNVGGAASGNTQSVEHLRNRRDKQDEYRRMLESQINDANERAQQERVLEQQLNRSKDLPPYLENRDS